MHTFYPCLWFDGNAQEAAELYASLLPDTHVDRVWRSPPIRRADQRARS